MDGYIQAEKMDNVLYKLLEQFPIRKNFREWIRLTRAVNATLSIIDAKCIEEYKQAKLEGGDE